MGWVFFVVVGWIVDCGLGVSYGRWAFHCRVSNI